MIPTNKNDVSLRDRDAQQFRPTRYLSQALKRFRFDLDHKNVFVPGAAWNSTLAEEGRRHDLCRNQEALKLLGY